MFFKQNIIHLELQQIMKENLRLIGIVFIGLIN